ncbi:MAG: hypothetical protein FWC43_06645, partial [Planctomycetaceae bacterium]|nr:hypothetical protein [Planctomycetaceae bacterium]
QTSPQPPKPIWLSVVEQLRTHLAAISGSSEAFKHSEQAKRVLEFVQERFIRDFRSFHADLLFHHTDDTLVNSFFLARVFEILLALDGPWDDLDELTDLAIDQLNDLLGYRPIPILEGEEKHQPNQHEWVAPIPIYIKGAGAAFGKYQGMVEKAIQILFEADPDILHDAWFDPERLEEIVLDSRAYDFDHPVNRRPNYHFGTWDMNTIDKSGYYTRFVVHQVTINGILQRYETAYTGESEVSHVPQEEIIYEAGAVLAGTMLMGSGVCGDGPQAHDSSVTLTELMPQIAEYRDRFYESLIKKVPEAMKPRLEQERARLYQPFGGARQDLNKRLAKRRADQLQRLHLARTFARMGYFDAAKRQTDIISVASARILCQVDCWITQAHFLADRGKIGEAAELIPQMENLLKRGIACGALVDPWTILGFGAQYSLFPAIDNSVHDHRVDDLIHLLDDIFDLYSRLQKEAAASGNGELQADLSDKMSDLAGWWDQFGSTDVSSVESFSGIAAWESAAIVSTALAAWHKAGTAAGDVAFWSRHVDRFKSPKAYVLLGEALLDQRDPVASMALMMHWLSQMLEIPLTEGDYSFHSIALRWMESLWKAKEDENAKKEDQPSDQKTFAPIDSAKRWELTKKFFDFIEVNADEYWSVPHLELDASMFESGAGEEEFYPRSARRKKKKKKGKKENPNELDDSVFFDGGGETAFDDSPDNYFDSLYKEFPAGDEEDRRGAIDPLFSAAYENVVYKDTANDGIDDDTIERKPLYSDPDDFELADETERISDRLAFLVTVFKLWKYAAGRSPILQGTPEELEDARQRLEMWLEQAQLMHQKLLQLLNRVSQYKVPSPRGTQESLMEYDHHRGTKEILLDRIVWTGVEAADTILFIQSLLGDNRAIPGTAPWQLPVKLVFSAIFRSDVKSVKDHWSIMLRQLSKETLLYIPTSRGGSAADIVKCRCLQQVILRLLEYVPRLGLITETYQLLETIQTMEQAKTMQPGAITEFDRLVETATRAIANCVAESSKTWRISRDDEQFASANHALVDYLERLIELLLASWLSHSRQIRISPIESLMDRNVWNDIKAFIQRYGHDIFTQQFMGFGNLRAVLHQGVENYLRSLIKMKNEDEDLDTAVQLIEDLETARISMEEAIFSLEIIFESVAENYSEYIDYNSTTTHSDKGEKLFMLLDMLRVLTEYERISWNLKPVYWVHDSMIRSKCSEAANLWERAVAKRSYNAAEEHLRHYTRLSEKYGMWLPSVHERLQERFVRPLQIDRMCGLVGAAIREAREDGPKTTFPELERQIEIFAREPLGVGYEIPEWLSSLQEEVMTTRIDSKDGDSENDAFNPAPNFQQIRLSRKELDKQIDSLGKRVRFI